MLSIAELAGNRKVGFDISDAFALGFLASQYGLENFLTNKRPLVDAVTDFDNKDILNYPQSLKVLLTTLDIINK